MIRTLKPKCCRACRNEYTPWSSTQQACSPLCAQAVAQAKRHKAEMADTKRKLLAIKPRSKWQAEAQAAFNAFIRERDFIEPCISCGRTDRTSWDAGHYLTTGARPELRFDECNVNKQCVQCNQHLHGNLVLYRLGLIERIGTSGVARLEGPHPPNKYDIAALKLIRDAYRARTRALKAQRESMLEAA